MKRIGRREFIKYSAGVAAFALLGEAASASLAAANPEAPGAKGGLIPGLKTGQVLVDGLGTVVDKSKKFGFVIDVGACIGCRTCMWACKEENNIPDTISPLWAEVFELSGEVGVTGRPSLEELKKGTTTSYTQSPREGKWYMPVACQHCDNPPCVKVCPVGATFKDKDGLVLMNYDRCIGCRICVAACPYGARRFNWLEPEVPSGNVNPLVPVRPLSVVEKCTFCVHRTRRGKLPRCVEVCPVQARHCGDTNDPESEVSRLLKSNPHFQVLEEMGTGPNVHYITRGKKWLK